jgi:hypothetical protein
MVRESNNLIIPSRFFCVYRRLDVYYVQLIALIGVSSSCVL